MATPKRKKQRGLYERLRCLSPTTAGKTKPKKKMGKPTRRDPLEVVLCWVVNLLFPEDKAFRIIREFGIKP